jgi:hypothetical protein
MAAQTNMSAFAFMGMGMSIGGDPSQYNGLVNSAISGSGQYQAMDMTQMLAKMNDLNKLEQQYISKLLGGK